jgi:hypothetical protein
VDGDGWLDLVAANTEADDVTVLLNRTDRATPVGLARAWIEALPDRVTVRWHTTLEVRAAAVERGAGGEGWRADGRVSVGHQSIELVDSDVAPGGTYAYRLTVVTASGDTWRDSLAVRVPPAVRLAVRAAPNPARGRLRVALALPGSVPAELGLWDVAGRRVARSTLDLGPGDHAIVWSLPRRLAAGVYLVRLEQAGERVTARITLAR